MADVAEIVMLLTSCGSEFGAIYQAERDSDDVDGHFVALRVSSLAVCDRIFSKQMSLNHTIRIPVTVWVYADEQIEIGDSDIYSNDAIFVDMDYPNPSDFLNVFF